MKFIGIVLLVTSFTLCGCGGDKQETEITITEDGQPARMIRIIVEGKNDVVIEDPYIAEIEAISAEYMKERERVMKEHETMSREEIKAFGDLQKKSGARIRELQRERRAYLIDQMKEHNGSSYRVEDQGTDEAMQDLGEYLKGFQKTE